ncbi:cyclin-H1-1-like isoform X2 [Vigna unguiculata]|uniref:B-like cyclin n=1 Tax=Vigna unguiculata TaxID=3917 RepID=A0A4D6NQD8_VIGUN|nr:cyclin-H1-1-like isoform X2 [Vigna unguiculata]QCE15182.1 cyclin H [Vigna unguiculata]
MADFLTSTQRAKWIFTSQTLVKKYEEANQRARQILGEYGATLMEVDGNGSLTYPEPRNTAKDGAEKHSRTKPLSIEQEKCVRVYYESNVHNVCKKFPLPRKVQATALIFFKRFYLRWSVMEHQPKYIMLACIYAACKIEEYYVSAEELSKSVVLQDHQMILNYEMIVYQSLEFDLIVYAPYRAVEGFINNMEEFCHCYEGDDQLPRLKTLQEKADLEVDKMMFTDASLLFPPGQLALAALRNANAIHKVIDFDSYLRSIFGRQSSMHKMSELSESLNAIDSWVSKYEIPSKKVKNHIDRKLTSCWGFSSHDEGKKQEKKSKHKSEKSSKEAQSSMPSPV